MASERWLADYLEQGRPGPGSDAPDAASADAARRLRALLAEPDSWAEPPAGLFDEILAGIDSERVGLASGFKRFGDHDCVADVFKQPPDSHITGRQNPDAHGLGHRNPPERIPVYPPGQPPKCVSAAHGAAS